MTEPLELDAIEVRLSGGWANAFMVPNHEARALIAEVRRLQALFDEVCAERDDALRAAMEIDDRNAKLRAVADAARRVRRAHGSTWGSEAAERELDAALASVGEADPVKALDDWNEAAGRPWKDRTPPDEEGT